MPDSKRYSSKSMERYFNDPEYRKAMAAARRGFVKRHRTKFLMAGVIVFGLCLWYGFYIVQGLPSLEQLENPRLDLSTKIYSIDGEVLDQFSIKNRTPVSLSKLPQGLSQALIATEDKQFYEHWGVNASRFIRQMIINIVTFRQAGASTITQQLARNLCSTRLRARFANSSRRSRSNGTSQNAKFWSST